MTALLAAQNTQSQSGIRHAANSVPSILPPQLLESITSPDSSLLNHTITVKAAVSAIHLLSGT
jgi:hypothetical protein